MTTSAPVLRPLGIGEILDVSLKIVWRNAGTLIRAVVFVVLPVQIVTALLGASIAPNARTSSFNFETSDQTTINQTDANAAIGYFVAVLVLSLIASTIANGACFRAIASAYLGERTGWRESLTFAVRRFGALFWITILVGFLSVLGAIACVIPGIYLWVSFAVAVPVMMTEGVRGRKALGRSRKLVRNFWWRTFAVTALGYLLTVILSGVISGLILGLAFFSTSLNSVTGIVANIVAQTLSKVLTVPFIAAFVTVLYFDLRVRKEAFDLQLLAQRIGVEPPPGAIARMSQPAAYIEPGGDKPPFWPPPPGWKPTPGGGAAPSVEPGDEQPPYWPPPPGWKPGGGDR